MHLMMKNRDFQGLFRDCKGSSMVTVTLHGGTPPIVTVLGDSSIRGDYAIPMDQDDRHITMTIDTGLIVYTSLDIKSIDVEAWVCLRVDGNDLHISTMEAEYTITPVEYRETAAPAA